MTRFNLRGTTCVPAAEVPAPIREFNAAQDALARPICDRLAQEIATHLPEAEGRIWHAHPVWFLGGNPIVGYSRLKSCVRLLFWSGQSFGEPGLAPEGTFRAAEARYADPGQIVPDDLARWLDKSRRIQWDYGNIRRNGGLRPLLGLD
jgi:hypothetical protein